MARVCRHGRKYSHHDSPPTFRRGSMRRHCPVRWGAQRYPIPGFRKCHYTECESHYVYARDILGLVPASDYIAECFCGSSPWNCS